MKTTYRYSVLHYMHDAATREFVNVGVVLYAPKARFLAARCTTHYARPSALFGHIDGTAFRRLARFVEREVNKLGDRIKDELPLLSNRIESVLDKVLPPDDSAMQFSPGGAGVSADLDRTLAELFERFVERYEIQDREKRTEEDVWRIFRVPLAARQVVHYLHPKKVIAKNYEYEFQHSWKNAQWHALEPISFDLTDKQHVLDKASRWLGRMTSLDDAHDKVKLHVLLGEPREEDLENAFVKAQNLLHRMPGDHEFYRENDAEALADKVAQELREHAEPE